MIATDESSFLHEQLDTANAFATSLAKQQKEANNIVVSWKDINSSKFINDGCGQFSSYYNVKVNTHTNQNRRNNNKNKPNSEGCGHHQEHQHREEDYYTLKCLKIPSPSSLASKDSTINDLFVNESIDFLYETVLLSKLACQSRNDNIVSLRGVSCGNLTDRFKYKGQHNLGYFFLIDPISNAGTLDQMLDEWKFNNQRRQRQQQLPLKGKLLSKLSIMPSQADVDNVLPPPSIYVRLKFVIRGIANAMNHLHKHGIIVRELRPDLFGLDAKTGCIKLYDLSTSCRFDEIAQDGKKNDDAESSSTTTSREICNMISTWYKSPEYLLKRRTYDFSTDVFSFAMITYHVLTLNVPFQQQYKHQMNAYKKNVLIKGQRPMLPTFPKRRKKNYVMNDDGESRFVQKSLHHLIELCWDPLPNKRPKFHHILQQLDQLILTVDNSNNEPSSESSSNGANNDVSSIIGLKSNNYALLHHHQHHPHHRHQETHVVS